MIPLEDEEAWCQFKWAVSTEDDSFRRDVVELLRSRKLYAEQDFVLALMNEKGFPYLCYGINAEGKCECKSLCLGEQIKNGNVNDDLSFSIGIKRVLENVRKRRDALISGGYSTDLLVVTQ